jgi:apolipoprotein N-acyltransferase
MIAQLAAVIGSAVAYGLCFPPQPWRGLAWVALVPLLVVLRMGTWRRAVLLAWLWTAALACTVNDWFPRAVSGYFGQPAAVGIALFLGVTTFTGGLQYMAFAVVYRRLTRLRSAAVPLLVAAAWVSADLMRLLLFGGDPWALLGYSQVGVLPLIQVADVTGVHGVTFVLVAVNAALAEIWCAARDPRRRRPALGGVAIAGLLVVAVLGYGAERLRSLPGAAGRPISVGVVQGNVDIGSQWRRDSYGRNLEAYLRLSVELLRDGNPRLLVWPESAMTFFLADEPAYRRSIASVLQPFGAQLIAGGPYQSGGDEPRYFNAAFLLLPDGDIRGRSDKRQLLPFAEYFPFGRVDVLRRNFGRVREFTPGEDVRLLDTVAGPAGIMICNEGFFPELAAAQVRAGATVLVNLANDSWLGAPKFSEPALDMVTLRAVEQRRWLIRASTSGPSALVDPSGRVTARSAMFAPATLAGAVEPRTTLTLYGRIGDAFAWACVVLTAATMLPGRWRA